MSKGLQRSLKKANRLKSPTPEIVSLSLGSPAAPSATGAHAAIALTSGAQAGYSTGGFTIDVPRNVTVKGNASGNAGNVVIQGTNCHGEAISETIALNGASEVAGSKIFATVTSVDLPAETHSGTDTVSIGRGALLGLNMKLTRDTVLNAYLANVRESTRPTVAVSASAFESNSVSLNSTLNGTAVIVDLYV